MPSEPGRYNNCIIMPEKTQTTFTERALADGYAEITGEGKKERIRYKAANHSERWVDPEEKARAEPQEQTTSDDVIRWLDEEAERLQVNLPGQAQRPQKLERRC